MAVTVRDLNAALVADARERRAWPRRKMAGTFFWVLGWICTSIVFGKWMHWMLAAALGFAFQSGLTKGQRLIWSERTLYDAKGEPVMEQYINFFGNVSERPVKVSIPWFAWVFLLIDDLFNFSGTSTVVNVLHEFPFVQIIADYAKVGPILPVQEYAYGGYFAIGLCFFLGACLCAAPEYLWRDDGTDDEE